MQTSDQPVAKQRPFTFGNICLTGVESLFTTTDRVYKEFMRAFLLSLVLFCGAAGAVEVIPLIAEAKSEPTQGVGYSDIYLAKRTLDPAANEIRVSIVQLDPSGNAREFITLMKVNGDRYTMQDTVLGFTGEGKLFGEPWKWTRWTYKVTWRGGESMTGEDERTPDGGLSMKKKYLDASGELRRTVTAIFHPLTEAAHALLFAKLLGR